ncbi:hypothetical protein TSIB_0194 [Thermococcus sibiricus MM 739]|uniref:Uncharacterized protein n=1 Tax=Thermococcus sibiricus (strain DSM 12597 / MM 739) TaxID=604354 RepID=C6A0W7_THESM|nr:hypothetical protein TSIB_0194 [Thermococcus sibiricus MM 739]
MRINFVEHIKALLPIFVLSNIPIMEQNFINIGTKNPVVVK